MSNTLPCRTLATPATPSDLSAPSIALPWGSRMPDLSVTVTRAFIATNVLASGSRIPIGRPQFYAQPALMHRGCGLFQQPPTARDAPAFANEPHGGPERRRRAGDDRQAVAVLERLRNPKRAQAAARDQQALGLTRLRHRL